MKTFHFSINDPTRFNIRRQLLLNGYTEVDDTSKADFSDANIGVNDTALQVLEYKHLLAQLMHSNNLTFMPPTLSINDVNFPQVLAQLQQDYSSNDWLWIYKPSTLNNGEGIKLFAKIDDIIMHYQTMQRLGGEFVIQRYIDNPHLLDGHKYTLRLYVIVSNYFGYKLYQHGYYNIGLQKYPGKNDTLNLGAHLTNEHLTEPLPNVIQMPTSKVQAFHLLMPQITSIVDQTLQAFAKNSPQYFAPSSTKAIDILGFDFLVDDTLKIWLLEINHGPWFPTTEPHVLQSHLFDAFWQFVANQLNTRR